MTTNKITKQQILQAESWEQRYRLLIQAGKQLFEPTTEQRENMQSISGCEVPLWFKIEKNPQNIPPTFHFQAYSEARIMNGLLWILLEEINQKTAEQLNQFDINAYFTQLGIAQRLASTKLNGLKQIEMLLHRLE